MNEMLFNGQTGWICPKCGHVWGPLMLECASCNDPINGAIEWLGGNQAIEQSLEHIRTRPPFSESSR
jgi:hypothetical protein